MKTPSREKPVVIYDGDCRFCCMWIERWRVLTRQTIDYRRSQDVRAEFPEISDKEFAESVQLIDVDGMRYEGADAVMRLLAPTGSLGRLARWSYEHIPRVKPVMDTGYRFVARNRGLFSLLTRILWGSDVRRPTFAIATLIFLRTLGVIYLIAFASFLVQATGLIGERGIAPVAGILTRIHEAYGAAAYQQFPTLCWLASSDRAIEMMASAGIVLSGLAVAGIAAPVVLFLLWSLYLSLVVAGQEFFSFQWDVLLLEAGFLAIFLAPFHLRANLSAVCPPRLARFLCVWLLFRFMFASGMVKLASGDPVWADLTALDYHYFTQPLPNPAAWYADQLPLWFQKASCVGMFFIELVLPFCIFLPRRPRMVSCVGFLALQALIAATGNYGFFNLLTAALCVLLVDDATWPKKMRSLIPDCPRPSGRSHLGMRFVWIALFLLSWVPFLSCFRIPMPWLSPLAALYEEIVPFRSINAYGLFAIMTTERREVIIQGSNDGVLWQAYSFRYKPGALDRPPPLAGPYMPRLDWQMWFAALSDAGSNPWFSGLVVRLLQAEPSVLKLLANDPFDGKPPRYVRALLDDYRFTTPAERRATGNWWKSKPIAIYCREISAAEIR